MQLPCFMDEHQSLGLPRSPKVTGQRINSRRWLKLAEAQGPDLGIIPGPQPLCQAPLATPEIPIMGKPSTFNPELAWPGPRQEPEVGGTVQRRQRSLG